MPKNKYVLFGSTTISIPPVMVGYKNNKQYLYPTLTPITHRLSYHNKKLAIKILTNPNSNYKIQRIPRTTKNISFRG
jgi:hypothetical protein